MGRGKPKVDIEIKILMSGRGIAGIEVLVRVRGVHGRVGVARNLVVCRLRQVAGVIAQVLIGGQGGGSVGRGVIVPGLGVSRVARVAELAKILVVILPVWGSAGAWSEELLPGQEPGVLEGAGLVPGPVQHLRGVTKGGLRVAQARALLPLDALVLAGGEAQARVVMVVAVVSSVVLRPQVLRAGAGEYRGHRGPRGQGVRGAGEGVSVPVLRQRVMRIMSAPGVMISLSGNQMTVTGITEQVCLQGGHRHNVHSPGHAQFNDLNMGADGAGRVTVKTLHNILFCAVLCNSRGLCDLQGSMKAIS